MAQPSLPSSAEPVAIATAAPDAVDLARDEITQARQGAQVLAELAEGVLLLHVREGFTRLAQAWRSAPPIFVRHVCPVQLVLALPDDASALDLLREQALAQLAVALDPALPFSVQTRLLSPAPYGAYDVNQALAAALVDARGAHLDVRQPEQVLSVVIAAYQGAITAFLGVSRVEENLSSWAGGVRRLAREEGQISRAEFKLLEALEWFAVRLPAGGQALDLGAAPGGWTRIARLRGVRVVAVDPALLAPTLTADAGVRHQRLTAEAYLSRGPERFDVILNDMRMDARDSARLMVAYARTLRPRGQAIMSLKLPETNRRSVLDRALGILRQGYEIGGARQLFHNRSEVTVYLLRRERL